MAAKQSGGAVSGSLKVITTTATTMALVVTWPIRALMRDGALAAAFRQGIHELGKTFGQMLPDSATVDEPGGIWRPTQGEIAADRKPYKHFYGSSHSLRSPGLRPGVEPFDGRTYDPRQSKEQDNGLEP